MDNYEPSYVAGAAFHKLNRDRKTSNSSGEWDPKKFTVEDSAFGFIVMKNGAAIILQSSWALNTTDDGRVCITSLSGTKAGAEMPQSGSVVINGIRNGNKYLLTPEFDHGGVLLYDGVKSNPDDMEAHTFFDAIRGKKKLLIRAEEAAVVTRILEGIYISSKTGKAFYFENE